MAIHISRLGRQEEQFTWTIDRTHEVIHVAVERLGAYLKGTGAEVVKVELTQHLFDRVTRQNGIEPGHLNTLTLERLAEPVVFADLDDGTHMLVDGSHRLVGRALLRMSYVPAYIAPSRLWRRFEITGVQADPAEVRAYLKQAQTMRA